MNHAERLRSQCAWQRIQGTKLDNNYPYGEHLRDCDICQAADHIEELQADGKKLAELYWPKSPDSDVRVLENWDEIEKLIAKNATPGGESNE